MSQEVIAHIGNDTGTLMLCDPSATRTGARANDLPPLAYLQLAIDDCLNGSDYTSVQFEGDSTIDQCVVVSTPNGDGVYEVTLERDDDGKPLRLIVSLQ